MGQIRCDQVVNRWLLRRPEDQPGSCRKTRLKCPSPIRPGGEDLDRTYWKHYWDSRFCSYPSRTGDLRSIIKTADFYSARQRHSTAMYTDYERPLGLEHNLMLCLPEAPPQTAGPKRHVRLYLSRGPGQISPSVTGRCLRCCVRTCTRPSWMPSAAAIRPPAHPPAMGIAAPGGRRAHQRPDRPPPRPVRGNRGHPPGEHLHPAERLQSHRRRNSRLPRPGRGVTATRAPKRARMSWQPPDLLPVFLLGADPWERSVG